MVLPVRGIVMGFVAAVALWLGCEALAQKKPQEKPNIVVSMSVITPDTAYARRYAEWLELRVPVIPN